MPSPVDVTQAVAPRPVSPAKVARTRLLLEGSIVSTPLRLAAPKVLNLVALSVIAAAFAMYCGITVAAFKTGARRTARPERKGAER